MAIAIAVAVGDAADPLVEKLRERAEAIKVGPGLDPSSEMGPVVTPEAKDRVTGYIGNGRAAGATAVVDGRELDVEGGGFFVGPTLFDNVGTEMDIYTDEIFGPVLGVIRVETLDDAIDLINANSYANGTAIFTTNGSAARIFQRRIEVGMVGINVPIPVPMAFHTFGGWKSSLFGERGVHGPDGVKFYTRGKVVTARWPKDAAEQAVHLHFPTSN